MILVQFISVSLTAVMAVVLSLVVMSGLAQSSPLYDELEGAPGYLESQVNTPTNIDLWPPDD